MTYNKEFNIDAFPWWSGAKDTIAEVRKAEKMDDLQSIIEENFSGKVPTETEVNDFVWFEKSWILTQLGIEDDDKWLPSF